MMKALLIVLSLSALAMAGPAFNKNNQIDQQQQQQQQQQAAKQPQQYMTASDAKSATIDALKQWCFSSQMSQQELTASFKKLVSVIKSNPTDQTTESAVMSERICQGALVSKSAQSGETVGQSNADAQAHELIKDVYMDALISCKSRDCTQQLVKIINSNKVDTIRASYYMTRIAVTEKDQISDEAELKQLADSLVADSQQGSQSDTVERQKLFAITSLIGKLLQSKPTDSSAKQTADQVAKTIVERYLKPVSSQEVQQYQNEQSPSPQLAKKIAKRSAAIKALANIPGHILKEIQGCEEILVQIATDKQELSTARQSAIECLEQNAQVLNVLKQITFDQSEPIEVRVAAYRALMTAAYADDKKDESSKQQLATEIVDQIVKHCEQPANQQQDDQFVLYAVSHLDNIRTSQQPEHQAIKTCISANKQHYMQIQVLCKKFKQQLSDVRSSSRNYKLEQEFNQLESGLVLEGDLIYESKQSTYSNNNNNNNKQQLLPKLIRVNMSMPVMGETVNVVEVTIRQDQMDEELLSALKLVQGAKFNSASISKVVDSFKSTAGRQQQQQQQQQQNRQSTGNKQVEADLTIKVDGCTIVYLCLDDFKASTNSRQQQYDNADNQSHQRNTRSISSTGSIVDDLIDYLKRQPVNFNRGFNFNLNERLAKLVDIDANVIAGLRFNSRASGHSSKDFEISAQMEPRFSFEAIVGPAKMSSKKVLQRFSTKSALGLRLRFKQDELVDVQVDLPTNSMELFTVESQIVEKSSSMPGSYSYLPESIYGQEDIYSTSPIYAMNNNAYNKYNLVKRSISDSLTRKSSIAKLFSGKAISHSYETSEQIARATGMRASVRVSASPKDMSFLVSAVVQKYDPAMQGYRFQVQKAERSSDLKQYIMSISTPGSRYERNMQVRITKQANSQRTTYKSEIQAAQMSATVVTELVHDGRQYAIKTELVSKKSSGAQWRHSAECGILRASQSSSGRLAATYKPYLSIDSSSLKRPIQLQGTVSYQDTPKTVISYELKCPTSGDYIQGKVIVDQRDSSSSMSKRSFRRSMQSPIELILSKDLVLSTEFIGQVQEHAVKVHKMIDWSASKWAAQFDFVASHKNLRKQSSESQVSANAKIDTEQQVFVVECKSAQNERKNYRVNVLSQVRPTSHQMLAEVRYNGRRQSLVSYKHKVDFQKVSSNKYEYGVQVEFTDTERQISEKMQGHALVVAERKMKAVQFDLASSRQKSCKVNFEYESLSQHALQVAVQTDRYSHKTEVRANERAQQYSFQSRTDKQGQMMAKVVAEIKESPLECQLVAELPYKGCYAAADLKFAPGRVSSIAVQTPRFAVKNEFSFDSVARSTGSSWMKPSWMNTSANLRFKTNLKDLMKKEAYWMDSAVNVADWNKQSSYLRLDSPIYHTDVEYDPRDSSTKLGVFARSKRSVNNYDSIYSTKDSLIDSLSNFASNNGNALSKLGLGQNKLWMLRSVISSPSAMDSLKQQVRRALFEYADRRQSHKHSFGYWPEEERVNYSFEHAPNTDFGSASFEPMRMGADYSTSWSRPSSMSFESQWMNLGADVKPFDGEESYAKVSALSRHRRSPFKKHESEWRYKKDQGHKAYMKHEDAEQKHHELRMEADESPKKWAKMSFESDKHGKADYEHKWRKYATKRAADNEDVYANKVNFRYATGPQQADSASKYSNKYNNNWSHESTFDWEEPIKMVEGRLRQRRDIFAASAAASGRYSPIEYLKHTSGRLQSQTRTSANQANLYNLDFDYQPQQSRIASLNVDMPDDMSHSSYYEQIPSERLYKVYSKLYNSRTKQPSYELLAATKPYVAGLATADQEPVFVNWQHQMLERPIGSLAFAHSLFKQPMKFDYSDKYGRVASFDYDQSPVSETKYAGLRQKRAAIHYKDDSNDFEHQSTYDFYPETLMNRMKSSYSRSQGDIALKTSTKYGPVVLRADSSDSTIELDLESPVMNAKMTCESSSGMRRGGAKLIKLSLDNKSQRVQLAKLVRDIPVLRDSYAAKKMAKKIDSGRFEHQSEMLVSIVDAIFKLKSQTKVNNTPVLLIEGEYNQQQDKAYAKINGERVKGQLVADLINKSANLMVDVDDKRTFSHVTRLARTSNKFYTLESTTSHQSKPVFKLAGKVSAAIFSEPEHLFARRRGNFATDDSHISTFEAVLYEPTEYQISAKYDCDKKEARIVFKNQDEQRYQETSMKYDDNTDTFFLDSRLSSANGQVYATKAKINLPSFFDADQCHYGNKWASSCQSELIYSNESGSTWATKFVPNEYVSVVTPRGKQTFNWSY